MTATATKPDAKALRKQAQALGIEGWEDLGRAELAKAVRKAEKAQAGSAKGKTSKSSKSGKTVKGTKSKTKRPANASKAKATAPEKAKKTVAKRSTAKASASDGISYAKSTPPKKLPDEGVNPFRKSSNLFLVAKLLLKGGTRRALAESLASKVELHPYHKDAADIDLDDYDKRLILGAGTMRDQYGYGIQRTGRGIEGKILVFRPGGPKDPTKKSAGQKTAGRASSRAAGKSTKRK